jgi:hypothetical protein
LIAAGAAPAAAGAAAEEAWMVQVRYKLIGADAALAAIRLLLVVLLLLMMAELLMALLAMSVLAILLYHFAAQVAWQ